MSEPGKIAREAAVEALAAFARGRISDNELAAIIQTAIDRHEREAWVSVEERLPARCEAVIGWDGCDILPEIHRIAAEPGWYDFSETDKWDPAKDGPITHWRPLPAPPEEVPSE